MHTVNTIKTNQHGQMTCPVCGGLECLCRPRFFAGQLLTEEDLNRLDRYIIAKNRLRNRYLHGWGVACGLEVICHHCEGRVTVKAGYALSPCGDDIVVSRDATVDVCELIDRCHDRSSQPDCDPPRQAGQGDNPDEEETWVLAIRYAETATRGAATLHATSGATDCGCGASSSSSSGCGCGCQEKAASGVMTAVNYTTAHSVSTDVRRNLQGAGLAQCEPTLTCEGYTFEVYKPPTTEPQGAMEERFSKCWPDLMAIIEAPSSVPQNRAQLRDWCCQWKEVMLKKLAGFPLHECQALTALRNFSCPEPNPEEQPDAYEQRVKGLLGQIWLNYVLACIRSVLLPPCPAPVEDGRVPLATIKLRRRDCAILCVCNLSVRKFLTTFPNLQYWLSPLPFGRQLRAMLARFCCVTLRSLQPGATGAPAAAAANVKWTGRIPILRRTAPANEGAAFSQVVLNAFSKRDRQADAETLLLALMGAVDDKGQPLVSEEELDNPLQFLMANQVLRPLVDMQLPKETPGRLGAIWQTLRDTVSNAGRSRASQDRETQTQLAELQETIKRQQEQLDELKERLPKK